MWRIKPTLLLLNNLDLWKTSRSKYNLAPQMILSDHSICLIPHQGIGSSLFSLFLIRLFSGTQQGRWWKGSKLVLHILPNQKPDPIKKTSHTIRSRCAYAWNFLMELALLSSWLYLFILGYGLSFFFFMLCAWIYSSPFFIARIFLHDEYEESCQNDAAFLCGWEAYFCVTASSVEVSVWVAEYVNLKKPTAMSPEVNI